MKDTNNKTTERASAQQQQERRPSSSSASQSSITPVEESSVVNDNEKARRLQLVEVVETTEDSMVVTVRGHVQDNLLETLSSLVAHEVKDMRKEGDDLILVLSIPDHASSSSSSSSSIPDVERHLQIALQEASQRELARCFPKSSSLMSAKATVARMPDDGNVSPGSLARQKLRHLEHAMSTASLARQAPGGAWMPTKTACKELGLAPDCYQESEEQEHGLKPPAICRKEFAEISRDESCSENVANRERFPEPRRGSVPGAFVIAGPEYSERSENTLLWGSRRELHPVTPTIDVTENSGATVRAFKVDEAAQEEDVRQRILEDAVEADVVDPMDLMTKKRKRVMFFICFTVLLSAIAIGLGVALSSNESTFVRFTEAPTMTPSGRPTEVPRPTLEKVLDRGTLRCGTAKNVLGLSAFREETNSIEGFTVDLCRAITAVVLGDSSMFEIVSVDAADRFEALLYGSVDVLARSETHTMDRELVEGTTGAGFSFSAPFLYSGLAFSGVPEFVDCAEELDSFFRTCRQLKICVNRGTSLEAVVDELFPASFVVRMEGSLIDAFVNGECNTIASEPVASHEAVFRGAGYTGDFKSGEDVFSNEPLAMVTRQDDPEWADMVNSVLHALWAAEAQGIDQTSAANFAMVSPVGDVTQGTFANAIAAVGNYGEIFSRHLDGIVPRSGLNTLNVLGTTGLHYVLPFGELGRRGPEPIQGGTLQTILDRGQLRCGLSSNGVGFAEFDTASQEWTGIDVSFCRVLSAALFAGDIVDGVEFVSLPQGDLYVALASGEVDVLAGGMSSLVNEVLEPTSMTGFSFSSPYFYGSPNGDVSDPSTRSLVTRQDDSHWSTFVYWCLIATTIAEERAIDQRISNLMPAVNLFGDYFVQMFRDIIASNGNYGEIYAGALEATIPRGGRNLLNTNPHGPQQFPYTLFPP